MSSGNRPPRQPVLPGRSRVTSRPPRWGRPLLISTSAHCVRSPSFSGTGQPRSTAAPRVAAATVRKGDSPVAMTTVTSHPVSLTRQVRDLRERGMSVKQIARTLGEKAVDIAPLVNAIAAEDTPQETDPGVVGCWASPGWSIGLPVHGHPEWRNSDATADFPGGIAAVLVARRHRTSRVAVCAYLIDTYG